MSSLAKKATAAEDGYEASRTNERRPQFEASPSLGVPPSALLVRSLARPSWLAFSLFLPSLLPDPLAFSPSLFRVYMYRARARELHLPFLYLLTSSFRLSFFLFLELALSLSLSLFSAIQILSLLSRLCRLFSPFFPSTARLFHAKLCCLRSLVP